MESDKPPGESRPRQPKQQVWREIGRFLYPFRRQLAGLAILTAGISLIAMTPPLMTRAIIDRVITRGEHNLLWGLGILMITVPVVHAMSAFLQVQGLAIVGQRLILSIRTRLYEHLLSLSMRFFSKHSVGKLINRLLTDSSTVQQVATAQAVQVLSDLVCATFALSITFTINRSMSWLLLGVVALFVLNYRLNYRRLRVTTRQHRRAEDRLAGALQNQLAANLTVKTYGAEDREHIAFRQLSDTNLNLIRNTEFASIEFNMNTVLIRDIGRAVIYFAGCWLVLNDKASYGDVIALTSYAIQLLDPAVRFSLLAQQLQDAGVSMGRILGLFHEQPEIPRQRSARRIPARLRGNVEFDHVRFGYHPDRIILHDFCLAVPAGNTVALVGPTGCGKTTLVSLLLRFYDVLDGAIRIDGTDIREMDPHTLRRQFGLVLQEPLLFDIPIADNIRYSRPTASRDEIEAAARVAEIHDEIMALPRGFDTPCGGRHGIHLSVGQKQRVSIARAVLADPAMIIMDEATSSLDSDSEQAIQVAMARFLQGRTSFVVAHRLSTIRNANPIVLLRQGRILETGCHADLMARPHGEYRNLYLRHMGQGVLEVEP
ncbi:MAG: hypothetical protein A2498_14150 [Lentisphaerae bacterium RIFOXYC12_FULL_60_16]|nr:MAG: hypothetical protein A2498_14150 [Lentisphaerae bacterium RIFOXYC12_FULL_60_16]